MMKKNIRVLFAIVSLVVFLSTTFTTNSSAATGYQGYAIYRDGVFFNYDWHAGIMDEPYSDYYLPVLHHAGSGDVVKWDSWENFLNGKNFKGVYRPNEQPSSAIRDAFVGMGRNLRTQQIPYNVMYQVYYDTSTASYYVQPDEISSMRCDGVVEYIYEWYYYRVYGHDTLWDVTKNDYWIRDHHGGTAITPKYQALNYLTLVTSSEPKSN
ncbi:MAG: hypothetical protein KGZ96_07315 [Clostridia bacterium]|nr:hypothetical protein [Clostridia bacterium]